MRPEILRWAIGLALLILLGYAFYLVFSPFLSAITGAVILAILLAPVHRWLSRWIRWRGARALLTCLAAAVVLLGPAAALGTMLVGELVSGLQYVQSQAQQVSDWDPASWPLVARVREWFDTTLAEWLELPRYDELVRTPDLQSAVVSAAQGLSQWLLNQSSAVFRNVAGLTFTLIVTWLTLYYLLKDGDRALAAAIDMLPYPAAHKEGMLERLSEVVTSSVYGGLAVALTQGFLGGLAFAVIGLPSPVLWGTVMAVLSFLPLVGAVVVWGPAAIVLMVQGRWVAAIGLVIWGALAVGLVDNFLRPMLISGRTALHPLLVFLAVLGGIHAFGFLGLFLGPVLVAVFTGLVDLYRTTLRGELVAGGARAPFDEGAARDLAEEALPSRTTGERRFAGQQAADGSEGASVESTPGEGGSSEHSGVDEARHAETGGEEG